MNNWETNLLPTRPWRSAMSIPRTLTLRRTAEGLRLVQKPVVELQALREKRFELSAREISGQILLPKKLTAPMEIIAEFEPGDAREFGFQLFVGENQTTTVGYKTHSSEAFVDRRASGNVKFDERFPGVHRGPLPLNERNRIKLHIFVDRSSVEVFGNDGHTVITDRIFPDRKHDGCQLYSNGGKAKLISLQAWTLRSVWN